MTLWLTTYVDWNFLKHQLITYTYLFNQTISAEGQNIVSYILHITSQVSYQGMSMKSELWTLISKLLFTMCTHWFKVKMTLSSNFKFRGKTSEPVQNMQSKGWGPFLLIVNFYLKQEIMCIYKISSKGFPKNLYIDSIISQTDIFGTPCMQYSKDIFLIF